MRDLANILRINKVTPIMGKDKIEVATVENWEVIVGKGQHSVGELVVYVEYDTVLPVKEEFEFLRSRCYSAKYNGFRISNMKMAGVFSQGIVFPLSILPEGIKVKEGLSVSEELGIRKYDPEEFTGHNPASTRRKPSKLRKYLMRYKIFRKLLATKKVNVGSYPETVTKSDETNVQKVFNWLKINKPDELYYKTEKVEGQATTYMLIGKKKPEYKLYSHNALRRDGDGSNWDVISKKYQMEKILRDIYSKTRQKLAVQGEIAGGSIQGNIYKLPAMQMFVYKVVDTDTGVPFNYNQLTTFCELYKLTTVPIYEDGVTLPETLEDVLEESDGQSVLGDCAREGIVWRGVNNQSIGFKVKSPKYLIAWNKKDATI